MKERIKNAEKFEDKDKALTNELLSIIRSLSPEQRAELLATWKAREKG